VLAARLPEVHEELRPPRHDVETEDDAGLDVVRHGGDRQHVDAVERGAYGGNVVGEAGAQVDDGDVLRAALSREIGRAAEQDDAKKD